MCSKFLLTLCCLLALLTPALALTVDTPLPDPAQEARARALFYQIRCVVCQSESIAESPADVAADIRREIRRRIAAGESDRHIEDYMVSRYGDFILMKPPLEKITWPLWFGPPLLLALAALLARKTFASSCGARSASAGSHAIDGDPAQALRAAQDDKI